MFHWRYKDKVSGVKKVPKSGNGDRRAYGRVMDKSFFDDFDETQKDELLKPSCYLYYVELVDTS